MDLLSLLYIGINLLTVSATMIGMLALWRMVQGMQPELGPLAAFGGGLIVAGGICVAINHFYLMFNHQAPLWLPTDLFSFLLPGFMCLAFAIWMSQQTLKGRAYPQPFWLIPIITIAALQVLTAYMIEAFDINLKIIQMTLVSIFSLVVAWLCVTQAYRLRQQRSIWLFGLYATLIIIINAASHTQLPLLLILICNGSASVCFMYGARQLSSLTRWHLTFTYRPTLQNAE